MAVYYAVVVMIWLSRKSSLVLPLLLSLCSAGASQSYNAWAAGHISNLSSQRGTTNDPDGDGDVNLVEFAFGTDPLAPGGISGAVTPVFGSRSGTNGTFTVELLEKDGHPPGAQIDLWLSDNLTDWFRPWWLRTTTNSQPSDPPGSARESFSTRLPGTSFWFVRSSVSLIEAGPETAAYYVATNGSDSDSGTSPVQPFATLSKAASLANPGNLIYLRGGTYHFTAQASLSRSGNPSQPIRVRAYPGESPTLDFTGEPSGSAGIQITGSWWQLYGLEIVHAGHNGIKITGHSNLVERCVVHESGDTGIHITAASAPALPASYNLILNCDSYRNYDPPIGGNADGFSAKFVLGVGNEFRGCRGWNNSDDGWDLWQATNCVVIENCITWSNGFNVFDANPATNTSFNGNGNGFKLGGNYYFGPHRIAHSISFGNKVNGYDQNNNNAGMIVDHNTAWANGSRNFSLNHGTNITPHVIRNNLSFAGVVADSFRAGSLLTNNSWQVVSPAATAADVLSTTVSLITGPRRDDGGIPETPFLRPVPTGRLVNRGVNIGELFIGAAPDLGAYETPEW